MRGALGFARGVLGRVRARSVVERAAAEAQVPYLQEDIKGLFERCIGVVVYKGMVNVWVRLVDVDYGERIHKVQFGYSTRKLCIGVSCHTVN